MNKSRTMNFSTVHDNHTTQRKLPETQMTADELSAIFLDLEQKRRSMDAASTHGDFRWSIMGGRWTREHLGVNTNCYRGYAASAPAKAFCQEMGLYKSFDVSIKDAGDASAMTLVHEWSMKMQIIYATWSDSDHGNWWGRGIDSYAESPEITTIYDSASAHLRLRIDHLRDFCPRFPSIDGR